MAQFKLSTGEWVTFLGYAVEPGNENLDTIHWVLVAHEDGQVEAVIIDVLDVVEFIAAPPDK